jgi:hypothetical protein
MRDMFDKRIDQIDFLDNYIKTVEREEDIYKIPEVLRMYYTLKQTTTQQNREDQDLREKGRITLCEKISFAGEQEAPVDRSLCHSPLISGHTREHDAQPHASKKRCHAKDA